MLKAHYMDAYYHHSLPRPFPFPLRQVTSGMEEEQFTVVCQFHHSIQSTVHRPNNYCACPRYLKTFAKFPDKVVTSDSMFRVCLNIDQFGEVYVSCGLITNNFSSLQT